MGHGCSSRLSLSVRAGTVVCWFGLLMLAGCKDAGPSLGKLVPVQGKITLADGKPLVGGEVTFVPIDKDSNAPSFTADGPIEEDGSYTLYTKGKPGAPPGKYRVVLTRGSDRKSWFAVPPPYFSQKKSTLEIEVTENKPEGGYNLKLRPR